MTFASQINNPLAPLLQWTKSSGHCNNMFNNEYKNIGVGAISRYWTHVFTKVTNDINIMNPMYDGTHWRGNPLFSTNDLYFLMNYFYDTIPNNITIVMNNKTERVMSLYTGTKNKGTYIYKLQNYTSPSCLKYVFKIQLNNATYKLPENGYYLTNGINNCTLNYSEL